MTKRQGRASLLQRLEDLARNVTVESRSQLLASITDMVFQERQPSPTEVGSLCDVGLRLLKSSDERARTHFAKSIAPCRHVPREVVIILADDTLEVARPILGQSPRLGDEDLVRIAETKSDGHLLAIASRNHLNQNVVEILVRRGSQYVRLAIVENHGASLSETAMRLLISEAEKDEAICRSLVRRPEVPAADAEQLVQHIARMLRARMTAHIAPVVQKPPEPTVDVEIPVPPKDQPRATAREMLDAVRQNKRSLDEVVIELANDDRFNDLTIVFSAMARIEEVAAMRLIVRADANGIAMVCRALDVSQAGFNAVAGLRRRRLKHSEAHSRYEREDYPKLNPVECRATLAQLSGGKLRL